MRYFFFSAYSYFVFTLNICCNDIALFSLTVYLCSLYNECHSRELHSLAKQCCRMPHAHAHMHLPCYSAFDNSCAIGIWFKIIVCVFFVVQTCVIEVMNGVNTGLFIVQTQDNNVSWYTDNISLMDLNVRVVLFYKILQLKRISRFVNQNKIKVSLWYVWQWLCFIERS